MHEDDDIPLLAPEEHEPLSQVSMRDMAAEAEGMASRPADK